MYGSLVTILKSGNDVTIATRAISPQSGRTFYSLFVFKTQIAFPSKICCFTTPPVRKTKPTNDRKNISFLNLTNSSRMKSST